MSKSQLACTYASLILNDDEMAISVSHSLIHCNQLSLSLLTQADNIKALVTAAGIEIEPYWPGLFAKALDGKDINDLLTTISSGGCGGGAAAAGGAEGGAEAAVEEKKKSSSSSDDGGGGGAMFDEDY